MKYVPYYRVSTKRQGRSGLGLEAQQMAVRAMAERNKAVILAEYVEVETGKSATRPKLLEAIQHAKLTNSTLVVAKLDRLARNAYFTLTLRDSGQPFLCCDNEHASHLTIGFLALIAQHEAEQIAARTKAALAVTKAKGKLLGSARPGHWDGREHAAAGRRRSPWGRPPTPEREGPLPGGARARDQAPPRGGRVAGDDHGLAQRARLQDARHEAVPRGERVHAENGLAADRPLSGQGIAGPQDAGGLRRLQLGRHHEPGTMARQCIQKLRPDFEQLAHALPEKIRASCSWPSKSGLANKKRRIGEAWSAKNSADQSCEVFISPVLKDPLEVAATLVHELVHCAVGVEAGTQRQVHQAGQGHRPGRENDGHARGRDLEGAPARRSRTPLAPIRTPS